MLAEPVEPALDELATLRDPVLGQPEAPRVEGAGSGSSMLLRPHEPTFLENLHVLKHGSEGHFKWHSELADGRRTLAQPLHHQPAAGVGQGVEDPVQVRFQDVDWHVVCIAPRGDTVKQVLNYWSGTSAVCGNVGAVTGWPARFSLMQDLDEVGWIALDSWWRSGSTTVTSVVPRGFASYVRVLHPASSPTGAMTWSTVARLTGHTMHPLAQWERISVAGDGQASWHAPPTGAPPLEVLAGLVSALEGSTSTPTRCFFAVWDGWGQLHAPSFGSFRSAPARARAGSRPEGRSPVESFVAQREKAARRCPRFELEPGTGREYLLGTGPLEVVLELADDSVHERPGVPVSMWWPADHAWFVASEIDFDSTLVGGPSRLRDALLEHDRLEAFDVPADGVLSIGGDTINPPPP